MQPKTAIAAACVVTVLVMGMAAKGDPPKSRLSLKLDIPKKAYAAGEAVDVDFTLRNTSQDDVVVLLSRVEWDFTVMVRDSHGTERRLTLYGERLSKTRGTTVQNFQRTTLKPGEGLSGRIRANLQYDMTDPGDYRISLAYEAIAPKEWHFDGAISPEVAVRVEPPIIHPVAPTTEPAGWE